jgi:hypothetical protein
MVGTIPVDTALGNVLLSAQRGAGVMSDQTEVTVVPSVLTESE